MLICVLMLPEILEMVENLMEYLSFNELAVRLVLLWTPR
jgi:hypothetical protein